MEPGREAETDINDKADFYKSAKKEFRNIGLLLLFQNFLVSISITILGISSYGMMIASVVGVIPFFVYRINNTVSPIQNQKWTGKIFIKWIVILIMVNIAVLGISRGIFTFITPAMTESAMDSLSKNTLREPIVRLSEVNLIDLFLFVLHICIFAPILEEIVFRGIILQSFERYGKTFAVLGSALLFGFAHGNPVQIPVMIVMGVILGFGAAMYSVQFSILLHICNNIFSVFSPSVFVRIPFVAGVIVLVSMLLVLICALKYRSQWNLFYSEEGSLNKKIMKSFLTSIPICLYILFVLIIGLLHVWVS